MAKDTRKPNWWEAFWQSVIRYETAKVTPWLAFRNALGITLPLLFGVITGSLASSAIVCTGALNVCFSDNEDPYAHRARRMLAACALVGTAVFVGSISGHYHWTAVLVAAGWAFAKRVAKPATAMANGRVMSGSLLVWPRQTKISSRGHKRVDLQI